VLVRRGFNSRHLHKGFSIYECRVSNALKIMLKEDLLTRTKRFALRIIKLVNALTRRNRGHLIGDQLFRAGTSSGANYRAACRSRSTAEFISKLCIVEEELDECMYWMELLIEGKYFEEAMITPLHKEANELLSITIASKKTAKRQ
jgi:four helix bundle protein